MLDGRGATGKAGSWRALGKRVASGVVLGPAALAAVWLGGWWLAALILLGAGAMATEWSRVTTGRAGGLLLAGVLLSTATPIAARLWPAPWLAPGLCVAGLALAGLEARQRASTSIWPLLGWAYVTLPCIALVWLRETPQDGRTMVLWLMLSVWATDIGGYFAGRAIGGPKLAPRISPNKTWAGLIGGITGAALVGLAVAGLADGLPAGVMVLAGAALAVVAQAGDLAESAWKRHFGVKDSGSLIPGHGGVLDRVDGLLFATIGAAMMALVNKDGLWPWR